jgi:hypothetical protein
MPLTLGVHKECDDRVDGQGCQMVWLATLEEVRGAGGVNRTRREFQEQFNYLLFGDGPDKIMDVLFEEFVVQCASSLSTFANPDASAAT